MKSNGKSVPGYSNSCGKQKLRKCSTSGEDDDLVLIDVDSDFPDVIIVDVPESVQKSLRKPSPRTVISIDDDDDDDDDKVSGEDFSNDDDPSPSNMCYPKPIHSSISAKGSGSRNHYGFGLEDESGSAESDCSDCECIEGPTEMIREQWELASQRRKAVTHSIRSGDHSEPGLVIADRQMYVSDQCSPTCVGNLEVSKDEEIYLPFTEHAFGSSLIVEDKRDHVAQALPGAENAGTQSCVHDHSDLICMEDGKDEEKSFSFPENAFGNPLNCDDKADTMGAGTSYKGNISSKDAEKSHHIDVDLSYSSVCSDKHDGEEPAMATGEQDDISSSADEDLGAKTSDRHGFCNCRPLFDEHMCRDEREPTEEELAAFRDMMSKYDFEAEHEELMAPLKTLRDRQRADSDYISRHFVRREADESTCEPSDESEPTDEELAAFRDMMSKHDFDAEHEETMATLETLKKHQKTYSDYLSHHFPRMEADRSTRKQSNDSTFSRTDVVTDRQKLKETDEYKRAMEELQESRQQQLKIQAEEAQRLRRRKRAETMRLMDMERRQKRRLEEIRETQKKDEQDLNMKEKIRAGIRKELSQLEDSCGDMASLLRRLGVNVNGDLFPPKNEVQTAYKRALLMFHPDRASRTDLREQVEAEEKFKLVSRMKEKLLSS